jgi:hypothetical protein
MHMDKKMEILDREDLRRNPYTVPEGYFDRLQERLSAIPRQGAVRRNDVARPQLAATQETRFRPALTWALSLAAVLAACFVLIHPLGPKADAGEDFYSYEQFAYADLIPHTDPYIYYSEEESQTASDPEEEEIMDYLLQYQIF